MSYDPTLGRFLERDPIGYDDGMNLYQFVSGNPTRFADPAGLFAIDSANPDINAAFARLQNSRLGQSLLKDMDRLEACAGKEVRVILSPAPRISSRTVPGDEIEVRINPYDQVGAFPNGDPSHNIITGPNRADVQIGTELDALMYHELQHALFYLMQACAAKHCIKVGQSTSTQRGVDEEEERIRRLENEYRAEKGYKARYSYDASDEQLQQIEEEIGRGTRGAPISGPPDFRGELDRRNGERRRRQGCSVQ